MTVLGVSYQVMALQRVGRFSARILFNFPCLHIVMVVYEVDRQPGGKLENVRNLWRKRKEKEKKKKREKIRHAGLDAGVWSRRQNGI